MINESQVQLVEIPEKDTLLIVGTGGVERYQIKSTLFVTDKSLVLLCEGNGKVRVIEFVTVGKADEQETAEIPEVNTGSAIRYKPLPLAKINLRNDVVATGKVIINEGELITQTDLERLSKGEPLDIAEQKIIVDNLGNVYRIVGQLAAGAAGEVWVAEIDHYKPTEDGSLLKTTKQVAMKIYRPHRAKAAKHEQEIGLMFEGSAKTSEVVSVRANVNEGVYLRPDGETAKIAMNIMEFTQNAIPLSMLRDNFEDLGSLLRFYFKVSLFIDNAHSKGRANPDFDESTLLVEVLNGGKTYFNPIFLDFDQYYGVRYVLEVALQVLNVYEKDAGMQSLQLVNKDMLNNLDLRKYLLHIVKSFALSFIDSDKVLDDMTEQEYAILTSFLYEYDYIKNQFLDNSRIDLFQIVAEASGQSREDVVKALGKTHAETVVERMVKYLPKIDWNSLVSSQIFDNASTSHKEELIAYPNLEIRDLDKEAKPMMGWKMETGNPFMFLGKGEDEFYDFNAACAAEDYNLVFTFWKNLGLPFQYKIMDLDTMGYELLPFKDVYEQLKGKQSLMLNRLVASIHDLNTKKELMLIDEDEFVESARDSKYLNNLRTSQLKRIYDVFKKYVEYFSANYLDGYTTNNADYNFRSVNFNVVEEVMNVISEDQMDLVDETAEVAVVEA